MKILNGLLSCSLALISLLSSAQEETKTLTMRSQSMEPTIMNGSAVEVVPLVNGINSNHYCRGCVVVYQRNNEDGRVNFYIHRVLAVSGDEIKYLYSDESSYVNKLKIQKTKIGQYQYKSDEGIKKFVKYKETIDGQSYFSINEDGYALS